MVAIRSCLFTLRHVCCSSTKAYLRDPESVIHFSEKNYGDILVIATDARLKISDKNGNNLSEDRSGVPIGEINELSG
jgi:hypothetical protein